MNLRQAMQKAWASRPLVWRGSRRGIRRASISFPPSDGLVPGAVVAIAKGGKLAYLQAIGFQDRAKTVPMKADFDLLDRLDVQAGDQRRRHDPGG